MGGKAKPTKHTAKEIQGKIHAAKMRAGGAGGGTDGKAKRTAPKQGKKDVYIKCQRCLTMQPSLKSMQIHYQAKHPKESWAQAQKLYIKQEQNEDEQQYENNYDYEGENNESQNVGEGQKQEEQKGEGQKQEEQKQAEQKPQKKN